MANKRIKDLPEATSATEGDRIAIDGATTRSITIDNLFTSTGFDALAPTTTRGDIIYRNATTNARLPAGTAGYLLQTNGAGADPSYAGFLQAGTSAATRTWQDKARERLSVKDFGAVGDGVANDTVAIQAAETYRASVGGVLVFPPGAYLSGGTTINRANGGGWRGTGAKLLANANAVTFATLSGAVTGSTAKPFTIDGLSFDGNGKTTVAAVFEAAPYLTTLTNLTIINVQYACVFQRGRGVTISNINQYGSGSWLFSGVGTGTNDRIFEVNISNVVHESLGAANWTAAQQWFSFYRAIGVNMTNVITSSLDGGPIGVDIVGACEGVFISNSIFVWPTIGIKLELGPDGVNPAYVYLSNVGLDQPSVSGFDSTGLAVRLTNVNVTFGDARTNSGDGIRIRAGSGDVKMTGLRILNMYKSGLVIENGAVDVVVSNSQITTNNQVAGAFFDVDLGASPYTSVLLTGRNTVGTTNATGQRVVNGVTSKEVSRNTGSVGTIANTTQTTLMSYTIPANTLQPGQKVKVRAYGTTGATANSKTIELFFGSQQIAVHLGAFSGLAWNMFGEVLITGVSTQEWNGQAIVNGVLSTSTQGVSSIAGTSSINVLMTGTNGTAVANDIVCNGFTVEILD
jgi:hypothetical protein